MMRVAKDKGTVHTEAWKNKNERDRGEMQG